MAELVEFSIKATFVLIFVETGNVPRPTVAGKRESPYHASAYSESLLNSTQSDLNLELESSPKDIAQYIFWTGDERSVAWAVNDFIKDGIVSCLHELRPLTFPHSVSAI